MAKHPHDHRHDDDDDDKRKDENYGRDKVAAPSNKPYDPPSIMTRAEDLPEEPVHTIADEQRERSAYYEEHLDEIAGGTGGGTVALDADGKYLDQDRREALERDGKGDPVSNRKGVVPGVGYDEPQSQAKKK